MEIITQKQIEQKIYTIRRLQVMLDSDLAEMYQVETRILNQAVKRNIERFPDTFRFQLDENEFQNLKSQYAASGLTSQNVILKDKRGKHRKFLPYVFTEQGVAMLSAVLRSEVAVQVSIQIMQAFVNMRKFFLQNASVFQRIDQLELKQLKTDENIEKYSKLLMPGSCNPTKAFSLTDKFLMPMLLWLA